MIFATLKSNLPRFSKNVRNRVISYLKLGNYCCLIAYCYSSFCFARCLSIHQIDISVKDLCKLLNLSYTAYPNCKGRINYSSATLQLLPPFSILLFPFWSMTYLHQIDIFVKDITDCHSVKILPEICLRGEDQAANTFDFRKPYLQK